MLIHYFACLFIQASMGIEKPNLTKIQLRQKALSRLIISLSFHLRAWLILYRNL